MGRKAEIGKAESGNETTRQPTIDYGTGKGMQKAEGRMQNDEKGREKSKVQDPKSKVGHE